jgi:hypothetical protein
LWFPGSPGSRLGIGVRVCYLRNLKFLGFVVLITAVETVEKRAWRRDSAVKGCSWTVGGMGFKQAVDVDNARTVF